MALKNWLKSQQEKVKVMSPLTPRKCYKVKYYAVRVGRKAGIYKTWSECKEQVCEYSGAIYKSFFHSTF